MREGLESESAQVILEQPNFAKVMISLLQGLVYLWDVCPKIFINIGPRCRIQIVGGQLPEQWSKVSTFCSVQLSHQEFRRGLLPLVLIGANCWHTVGG